MECGKCLIFKEAVVQQKSRIFGYDEDTGEVIVVNVKKNKGKTKSRKFMTPEEAVRLFESRGFVLKDSVWQKTIVSKEQKIEGEAWIL